MKTFEQTNNLVRFRVPNSAALLGALFDISDARHWIWRDAGDGSIIDFVCPEWDAQQVRKVLAAHGIERRVEHLNV